MLTSWVKAKVGCYVEHLAPQDCPAVVLSLVQLDLLHLNASPWPPFQAWQRKVTSPSKDRQMTTISNSRAQS